jgi:hypothetical protein
MTTYPALSGKPGQLIALPIFKKFVRKTYNGLLFEQFLI